MLTTREIRIAVKLLTAEQCATTKNLAEAFRVSSRTIKYDLKNIRVFCDRNGMPFCSQSGKGVWVDCTKEQRVRALQLLSQMEKNSSYYSQEARIPKILFHLLSTAGAVTTNYLAESLDVSRNTVLSDLHDIGVLAQESGLSLARIPRVGYELKGSELKIRSFFESVAQKNMSVYDVYTITARIKSEAGAGGAEFNLPECFAAHYPTVEEKLKRAFQEKSADIIGKENIILVLIKILISVTRMKAGHYLGDERELPEKETSKDVLYPYLLDIFKECGLSRLEDEFLYIEGKFHNRDSQVDIAGLTAELVEEITRLENFPYSSDSTLFSRLLSHLTVSVGDPGSNHFENPFNDSIRKNHFSIFNSVRGVCQKHMPQSPLASSDSFVSYLVLHFLVTKKRILGDKKYTAIFICATGRGAAKLINRMLESEIGDIKVLKHCSLVEAEDAIRLLKPDIIISVFPIESPVPVVLVDSLPTKENINAIRAIVRKKQDYDISLQTDEDKNILDFHLPPGNAEEICQEIILIGLNLYHKLMEYGGDRVANELLFAFQAHCMLLAHRYYFNKQYAKMEQQFDKNAVAGIKSALSEIKLEIEPGEIIALMNYFNEAPDKEKEAPHVAQPAH